MMRLAYIADVRGIGGVQNWALGLAAAQRNRGHEVAITLPPGVSPGDEPPGLAAGIPVEPWSTAAFDRADVVHSFDGRFNPHLKSAAPRLPIVHTSFGASAAMFVALGRYLQLGWYLNLLREARGLWREAAGSRGADWVIASSEKVRRELSLYYRVPASKITVIHGGHWKQGGSEDKRGLRKKLGLPQRAPLILFVGERRAYKAFDCMLRCFRQVRSRRGDVVLVTAPAQGNEAEDGIVCVSLSWDRMPELYRACDLLVSTSKHEGYSLAYHEAMASGLPVIIPDCAGIVDLCVPGENAIVLPRWRRFEERLLQAVVRLLDDEALRLRLGQNARAAMAHRTWDRVAEQTERVYARAIEKARAR